MSTRPTPRIIALVEDGAWRVKDTKTGAYLCAKERFDNWHEAVLWVRRDQISDSGWNGIFSYWGPDDDNMGLENGRAARAIAALADELANKAP